MSLSLSWYRNEVTGGALICVIHGYNVLFINISSTIWTNAGSAGEELIFGFASCRFFSWCTWREKKILTSKLWKYEESQQILHTFLKSQSAPFICWPASYHGLLDKWLYDMFHKITLPTADNVHTLVFLFSKSGTTELHNYSFIWAFFPSTSAAMLSSLWDGVGYMRREILSVLLEIHCGWCHCSQLGLGKTGIRFELFSHTLRLPNTVNMSVNFQGLAR